MEKRRPFWTYCYLERKGLSQRKIARKLGISRNTVKKYVKNQEYHEVKRKKLKRKSLLDPFIDNIDSWLDEDIEYQATWIYDRLCNMGFIGSYETVKREVHRIKAERQRIAYMRFETEPGFQAQVDFGEFPVWFWYSKIDPPVGQTAAQN
ncbi:MAG: transposase [Deltaproteobacteria bacterium]|nr:transposase [Deltaproteobacteria bacterium]